MEPQNELLDVRPWHTLSTQAAATALSTNGEAGLTPDEAVLREGRYGFNELPEAPPPSLLKLFLSQFTSVIVWVLIGAAVISGLLEDWLDAAAILAIVFLNGLLGFVQEFRAERSLAALRKMSVAMTQVIRGGMLQSIPARELVPGDLIVLEAGDRIPADARLIYTTSFSTQEASLTGESTPVLKDAQPVSGDHVLVADRMNMAFMGTTAVAGKARALVVTTGLRTELGKIAGMIQQATEAERVETPLQRRLEQFGYTLLWLALGVVAVVFGLGYWRGEPLLAMFLTSVSLAVAAVPEGLPAVVTITLALGVTRMVKRHALIRKLPAVETLGSATVICTDKTGTLTKNEMTVTKLFVGETTFDVSGEGYTPTGEIREVDGEGRRARGEKGGEAERNSSHLQAERPSPLPAHPSPGPDPGLRHLLTAGVLCNGATLRQEKGTWQVIGDPTEGALLVAAAKATMTKQDLEQAAPFEEEIPFDTERKMMTVIRRTSEGPVAYVKGAPDVLLSRCTHRLTLDNKVEPLGEPQRQSILKINALLAQESLRVLAAAQRRLDWHGAGRGADEVERELVFLGLFAMKDPLRPEAVEAVRLCREAGIKTVMITGDHKETAVSIARELGLYDGDKSALSGSDINNLTDEQLAQFVERVTVYARVSAEHKLRIVQAWKRKGAIVAMTGDGVNDAPAIKAADIGVAMGLTGTDVTKEASDMVVTDDNFASIAAAAEEGRAVFDNIRKTIHYLLSCNISEVLVMLLATLFGLPLPLLPVQILWINLVTDGLPALALAVDPADPDVMRRPPRHPQARILDRDRIAVMAAQGLFMAIITIATFAWCLYGMDRDLQRARGLTFTILVFVQLCHAFNCRSDRYSLFQIGFWTNKSLVGAVAGSAVLQAAIILNPWAAEVFKVGVFNPEHLLLSVGIGLLPLLAMESIKLAQRRWRY